MNLKKRVKERKSKHNEIKFINCKAYILAIGILLFFLLAFNIMYRVSTVFATGYSQNVYPYWVRSLGYLCSAAPFSVFELLIVIAICLLLFCIVKLIVLLCKYHKKAVRFRFWYYLKKYMLNLVCIVLVCLLVYSLTCGVNYYRIPFSVSANIKTKEHSTKDLKSLCRLLVEDANKYSEEIPLDEDGFFTIDNINLADTAAIAMEELSLKYPCLSDYYPDAKPIFFSKIMSYMNICGIYSPFTIEANYNNDITDTEIPFTICHELSHLSGFMREDEANFIAYLGCMESDAIEFRYSGTLLALIYVSNQVYENCEWEEYDEIMSDLSIQASKDLDRQNLYWMEYEEKLQEFTIADKTIADISSDVNNVYLQTNGQADGVQSYDRVTDLLLTYYEDEL